MKLRSLILIGFFTLLIISLPYYAIPVKANPGSIRFSLKEHKRFAAYTPEVEFTKPTGTILRMESKGSSTAAEAYFFIMAPRVWLDGKYIRWNWEGFTQGAANAFRSYIYDGAYDRSSDTDFPEGEAIANKGNGLLQTLIIITGTFGPTTQDILVDVSGGTEEKVTIFIKLADGWTSQIPWLQIDWFEINSEAGGVGNLEDEQFTDDITMEVTGTDNDYGYISEGEIGVAYSYITFYENSGGIMRYDNGALTNTTEKAYINNTLVTFEIIAIVEGNMTYGFNNFTYNGNYNCSNPFDFNETITANMTLWVYFGEITGEGVPKYTWMFYVGVVCLIIGVLYGVEERKSR